MRPSLADWIELRFGVEIEFVGGCPEGVALLPGWIMSLDERQIDDTGAESGSELKPPPIQWADRGQIREMLARLRETGACVNWNCGLHVHVGLEPWGQQAIPRFIEAALLYQDAMRELLNTGEARLPFCPPFTREMYDRFVAAPGSDALCRKGRPQSHRCGINLAAWYDIGTVEIRYANGSLDYDEAINTVELCLRFVAAIGAGRRLSSDPRRLAIELGAPVGGYPPPKLAPQWYRERMWLEDALVPILAPLARSLVPDGEILYILPRPEGILAAIEDADGRLFKHLLRPTSAGWEAVRPLQERS
ncbi:amidoligase family protein [Cohnella rhizosphaerae]|uniref:Amidoligase family protein n=1 Tax=Cohnella rhizosphaerae TaxID=1457232 RepID=A0A9X4KUF7_9BACL|nr:amidoligase family protein [Cohnella rhizosphaerae]MDG0811230.1 amidoligase family protein [Cohnella rhizosphaerae]